MIMQEACLCEHVLSEPHSMHCHLVAKFQFDPATAQCSVPLLLTGWLPAQVCCHLA